MTIRSNSNNCPLPHDVPGCAVVDTSVEPLIFNGYHVVIERDKNTVRSKRQRIVFYDYLEGVLYASLN